MLLCLYVYYKHGDMNWIITLVLKPLRVSVISAIMGKMLDLEKRFVLESYCKLEDDEPEMISRKEL
jgi:hypothetical protein